jgi:predicted AAA+ superfamily ATPase
VASLPLTETIKSIILDFQESGLETGVPRRLHMEAVRGKPAVCIGVRRSGKSTYLFQVIERPLARGVPIEDILYLNLFDDRLHDLRAENLGTIVDAYHALYPEKKNAETVCCVDHALVTPVSSGILVGSGHLLENLVFTALRRLRPEIFHYKTKTGEQVHYILPMRGRKPILVQVCESLAEPQTRKRETAALSESMAELGVDTGTIVTRNESGRLEEARGTIEVVPAWRFLLEFEESAE